MKVLFESQLFYFQKYDKHENILDLVVPFSDRIL